MGALENIVQFWPLFLSAAAGLIWLVRLEGKVKAQADRSKDLSDKIKDVEVTQKQLTSKLYDRLNELVERLSRIEGALGIPKRPDHH